MKKYMIFIMLVVTICLVTIVIWPKATRVSVYVYINQLSPIDFDIKHAELENYDLRTMTICYKADKPNANITMTSMELNELLYLTEGIPKLLVDSKELFKDAASRCTAAQTTIINLNDVSEEKLCQDLMRLQYAVSVDGNSQLIRMELTGKNIIFLNGENEK